MNLINAPHSIHLGLRLIAPFTGMMPKAVLNLRYRKASGRWVKWSQPENFQQRIFVDYFKDMADPERAALLARLTDKYAVREYVASKVGEEALTKLYGVWSRPEDIDFDSLPVPCVLKTNNGCGTNIIVKDRASLDPAAIRSALRHWLVYPYGKLSGQPHYILIEPKIIAEEYLEQTPGSDDLPYDYKFFCIGGEPRFILLYCDRALNSHLTSNRVVDLDWNEIEGAVKRPSQSAIPKPEAYDEMLSMVRVLCREFPFVRVDFYGIGSRPVFGELTFTPDADINLTPDFQKEVLKYY